MDREVDRSTRSGGVVVGPNLGLDLVHTHEAAAHPENMAFSKQSEERANCDATDGRPSHLKCTLAMWFVSPG